MTYIPDWGSDGVLDKHLSKYDDKNKCACGRMLIDGEEDQCIICADMEEYPCDNDTMAPLKNLFKTFGDIYKFKK